MNVNRMSALTVLLILLLSAQVSGVGIAKKGVKAGVSISKVSIDAPYVDDRDYKIGFTAGGFVVFSISPHIGVAAEILYAEKGDEKTYEGRDDVGDPTEDVVTKWKFNYLDFPVLITVSPLVGGRIAPKVFFGPAFSVKLSSKHRYKALLADDYVEDDMEFIADTDFAFIGGAGVGVDIGASEAFLEVRYNLGLTNIYDPEVPPEGSESVEFKNRSIYVMAGYSF